MFHYGKADNVTATLKQLAALVPIGVPVEETAFLKSMTAIESQADFCYPKPIAGTTIEELQKLLSVFNETTTCNDSCSGLDSFSSPLTNTRNLHIKIASFPRRDYL